MKKRSNSESGAFNPRIFCAFLLCSAGAWLAAVSFASTPSSGTITDSATTTSYTAGPFSQPNQSPVGLGQLDQGPRCDSSTFPCDSYALTVTLPSGYTDTYPNAGVKVTMSWVDSGTGQSDYDLYVYNGTVGNLDGSQAANYQSASGANPEIATISPLIADGAPHNYTIKIVPYTPTGETVNVQIELVPGAASSGGGGGFAGFGGTDPTVAGNPRYLNFYAPSGTSAQASSGEFNIGFNPSTGRIMTMNIGPIWRITPPELFGKPECCEGLWEDRSSTVTDTGLDPILWTDQLTGRTFASNSTVGANAVYAYTDSDGEPTLTAPTGWTPIGIAPPNNGADHETIGSGPYPLVLGQPNPLITPINHGQMVFYCSQDIVGPAACQRSDDLGMSYGVGVLAYDGVTTPCGGLHGHLHVAPDGTAWLPVNQCSGLQGGAFSTDSGLTWTGFTVPNATSQTNGADPSIAIDSDSTIYYSYVKNEPVAPGNPLEGHAHVAVGQRSGNTINWLRDIDVGRAPVNGDHGIVNAAEIEAVGGSSQRAAVAFLGTDRPGDYQALGFPGTWYAFVAATYDQGRTWTTVNASPNDPVQKMTGIWQGGGGPQQRNLLDFTEITVDSSGNVLYGYSDGCVTPECVSGGAPNDFTAYMRVARQSGGRSIYASHDSNTDLPGAPKAPKGPCLSGTRDSSGSTLNWKVPDNGGAVITSYLILRGTSPGSETQIATYSVGPGSKAAYFDATADPNVLDYYYKIQAVNSVNPGNLSNEIDLPVIIPPPPQSPCQAPGVTLLTDSAGDSLSPAAGTDMLSASIAQPYVSGGNISLIFTILTDPDPSFTTAKTPGAGWYLAMRVADANQPDGFRYTGVRMDGAATGPTFSSYVPGQNSSGTTDGRFIVSQQPAGAASNYDPNTGTITIVVPASQLGLSAGSVIAGFVAGSSQTTDVGGLGTGATEVWDSMPESLTFINSYTVGDSNALCGLLSAVSRKVHGNAGTFDIPLPLTGTPGLETRGLRATGNTYKVIYTLGTNVTSAGSASSSQGSASATTGPGPNQVTVALTGISTAQHLIVTLTNVGIAGGGTLTNLAVPVDILIGDTTQNRHVDSGDVTLVRRQNGKPVTAANFRADVNANGHIDAGDVTITRRANGSGLTP